MRWRNIRGKGIGKGGKYYGPNEREKEEGKKLFRKKKNGKEDEDGTR